MLLIFTDKDGTTVSSVECINTLTWVSFFFYCLKFIYKSVEHQLFLFFVDLIYVDKTLQQMGIMSELTVIYSVVFR